MSDRLPADVAVAASTPQSLRRFLAGFIGLTVLSGITIGMNKVQGTLLGLHLGATPFQLGVIGGAETLAMALGTLPAGRLLGKGSPRLLYAAVSLVLTGLYMALPHFTAWQFVALCMFLVGLCISVRIVAMSTVFLVRLPELGQGKAGWYKGALTLGIQFFGPVIGSFLIVQLGLKVGFAISGLMFAILAGLGLLVLPDHGIAKAGTQPQRSIWADLAHVLKVPVVRTTYLFEILGSMTGSSIGVFSIVMAVQILHWPTRHGVWLMATQGIAYVIVLFVAGPLLMKSPYVNRVYHAAHLLIAGGLLLLGTTSHALTFLLASVCFGFALGINNLVNISRISQAPVDKAVISSHLTLFGMLGGTIGAVLAGALSHWVGLQGVFLVWALPWLLIWPGWRAGHRWALTRLQRA